MISFFKRNHGPVICERSKHCISRVNIDHDALRVLYRLSKSGYVAYLVGGSVRDLLMGRQPKDFDVGTDARPNEIRRLFRNCFLIGKRFRLAHIVFGRKVIETSTFRRQPDEVPCENGLYQMEDNTFGTPEEDAKRRDFTVNGLFYDIKTFAVIDYVGGLKDLEKRLLRSIGDPNVRFREDPVRMLRAVKFSARLDFTIERSACKAIEKHHADIRNASSPRVSEEIFRLFTFSSARSAFFMLWKYGLMQDVLPGIDDFVNRSGQRDSPLWLMLAALDAQPASNGLSTAVRLAALLHPVFTAKQSLTATGTRDERAASFEVAKALVAMLATTLNIPKNMQYNIIGLLESTRRFAKPPIKGTKNRFMANQIFPDALAFQKVLLSAGQGSADVVREWEEQYARQLEGGVLHRHQAGDNTQGSDAAPDEMGGALKPARTRRRPRRRRPATGNITLKQ